MKIEKDNWLLNLPIAHRGLFNERFPENSLPAYQNAIDNGFPIEIDLYETTDEVLLSFHDSSLFRMTGEKGVIYDKSYGEIKNLSLKNSNEKIPTFDEVLSLCEGKTPILIELKNQPSKKMVHNVLNRLKSYKGEYAIQSFNPLYIKAVKDYDDKIIRGILSAKNVENESLLNSFVVKYMPLNFLCSPDFISREYTGLPLKKSKKKDLPVLAWTIKNENDYKTIKNFSDNIIFENFIPKK